MIPDLSRFTPAERRIVRRLSTPAAVQSWLRSIPYSWEPTVRTFRGVVRARRANCLEAVLAAGLLDGAAEEAAAAAIGGALNALLALGTAPRRALRLRLFDLLSEGSTERPRIEGMLHAARDCVMHLPARIGDYTDFYAGIQHATNVGALFRPGTDPGEAFRPVRLVEDFRGIAFVPVVTADEMPTDRPRIPARRP